MKTEAILSRSAGFELTAFLGLITLLFAFNQPVMAALTPLQIFCAANAMDRVAFPEVPASLKCTPVPEPYTVDSAGKKASIVPGIIKNKAAAIALGKMLFWDSQVGSDGLACASCHFQAGADNRSKNQIDPGLRNASPTVASDGFTPIGTVFDFMASNPNSTNLNPLLPASGKGPNYTLKKKDFPLRQYQEPASPVAGQALQADRNAKIVYDSDDVISSQGVFHSTFNGLTATGAQENCTNKFPISGPQMPLFNVAGNSVRQVEPRNTPTVINAVYNFRNFWDGRANNVFNGLDPFGLRRFANPALTPAAEIYTKDAKGNLVKNRVAIYNASLASQAVGPALSDMEMSCAGKKFPDLGRKMLALKPLGKQKVDVSDSVLGPYVTTTGVIKPINTYKLLIQSAFNNAYWDVPDTKTIGGYKLIENNFSLFWGLAVQAYEATLVSDDSRFDQSINGRDKLTAQEQNGLNLFLNQGKCVACHMGAEFTSASVTHVENAQNASDIGKYILRMLMGDGALALYDDGFYNIGVRPTAEDLGVGASDPYGYPLSFTRNAKKKANNSIVSPNISSLAPDPFKTNSSLFANLGCIAWNPDTSNWGYLCGTDPVVSDEREAVDGAFKTSTLRNVELTGPYFHNGGQATLEQVMQFYNRGGDRKDLFPKDPGCGGALFTYDAYGNNVLAADQETGLIDDSGFLPRTSGQASNIAPDMAGTKELLDTTCNPGQLPHETLNLTSADVADLVAFMKSLTDDRVRWEKAPFDHPSLAIPNGQVGDENKVTSNPAVDQILVLPAVGAAGRKVKSLPALQSFDAGLR
ncbi:MAG: cytochrome c peroxidase [Methylococcaceae bacterium]